MKPINTTYDVEMDMLYNVKKENIEDIKDFTTDEEKWFNWLLSKMEEEEVENDGEEKDYTVKNELTNFIYNILLYRNLKAPEFVNGMYRANKVIKVNKLMSQKGGLKPWNLEEIRCSGLYTVHPIWFIEDELLPENVEAISQKDLERLGLPDICLRSRKKIRFADDRKNGTPSKEMYCWLESTPFSESQLVYNSNWSPVFKLEE